MNESIIVLSTQDDKAALKLAASQRGVSMSYLVRELLIAHKIISPIGQESPIDF